MAEKTKVGISHPKEVDNVGLECHSAVEASSVKSMDVVVIPTEKNTELDIGYVQHAPILLPPIKEISK